MIEATGLYKRYGATVAVDDLSVEVRPGRVTGFLGPNGAGKSTTIRLMLGLDAGGGRTLFSGKPYRDLRHPMREVGTLLDAKALRFSSSEPVTLTITVNGQTQTKVEPAGTWTVPPPKAGVQSVSAQARDAAGNVSLTVSG